MSIIIYHNGECNKSKGALELLQDSGVPYEVRYYLAEPLNRPELDALLAKMKIPAFDLVRTIEPLYIEVYEGKELAEEEWRDVLVEHPILIQRPVVEKGDVAFIARPPERVLEIIG